MENVNVGDVFHDNGFISTSSVENAPLYKVGGELTFIMTLEKGVVAADISDISVNGEEAEILIDRGANIRVDRFEKATVYCTVISQTASAFPRPEGWDDDD